MTPPTDRPTHSARTATTAAAVSGVLYFIGAFVPQVDGPPVETATATQVRTFLETHTGALRAQAVGHAISIALILVFAASIAKLLRLRSDTCQWANLVVPAGVLVAVWHWFVAAGTPSSLVQLLDGYDLGEVSDATLVDWYAFGNIVHLIADLGMVGMVVMVAAASHGNLSVRFAGRWVTWFGLAVAVAGTVGTLGIALASKPLAAPWIGAIFGWYLWIFAIAVSCGVRALRDRVDARGTEEATTSPAIP